MDRHGTLKDPCPWCGSDFENRETSWVRQKELHTSNAFVYLLGGILAVILGAAVPFFFWWIPIGVVCVVVDLKKLLID